MGMTVLVTISCECDRCGTIGTVTVSKKEWKRFKKAGSDAELEGWSKFRILWGAGTNIYCIRCLAEAKQERACR